MGSVTTMDKKELTKLVSYFIMGDGGAYIICAYDPVMYQLFVRVFALILKIVSVIKSECLTP